MDKEEREKIALFRFGVIAPLIGVRQQGWGQRTKLLNEISGKQWDIPGSGRSHISRATLLNWLKRFEDSGKQLESLHPKSRSDRGTSRKLDRETELALVNLKRENPGASLPVILEMAKARRIISGDLRMSHAAIYRIIKKHLAIDTTGGKDRRKFEAELPNDLWQADCMHGPYVIEGGKRRKAFLFAIVDDHSRIIPHAEFYLAENLDNFLKCLKAALAKRGLPRKLYVDNGPYFKAQRLAYSLASLGTALLHTRPYIPEGKGKIERWFRTVRMCFLPRVPDGLTLAELNEKLSEWIDHYHGKKHSSTAQSPLERYIAGLHLVRPAPKDMESYFRLRIVRRVNRDRSVSLGSRLFEAPCGLIGKKVELYLNEEDPLNVEIFFNDQSWGKLTVLDQRINAQVHRNNRLQARHEGNDDGCGEGGETSDAPVITCGKLFESGVIDE